MNGHLVCPPNNPGADCPSSSSTQTLLDFKELLIRGGINGYLSRAQIFGNPRAKPKPIPPLINVKKTCFYKGILSGKFPSPVRGGRYALWKCEDILDVIIRMEKEG